MKQGEDRRCSWHGWKTAQSKNHQIHKMLSLQIPHRCEIKLRQWLILSNIHYPAVMGFQRPCPVCLDVSEGFPGCRKVTSVKGGCLHDRSLTLWLFHSQQKPAADDTLMCSDVEPEHRWGRRWMSEIHQRSLESLKVWGSMCIEGRIGQIISQKETPFRVMLIQGFSRCIWMHHLNLAPMRH